MLRIFFIFFVFVLSGCGGVTKKSDDTDFNPDKEITVKMRKLLLGEWCGEKSYDDGRYQKWIVNRFPDGTYKIDFTTTSPSEGKHIWGEYGFWGIRSPIYFTAMKGFIENNKQTPADPSEPAYYDAYKVLSLTQEEFTYKSYTSGNTFTVKRSCSAKSP